MKGPPCREKPSNGPDAQIAILQTAFLSQVNGHVGAIAFSRTGDLDVGKFRGRDCAKDVRCADGRSDHVVLIAAFKGLRHPNARLFSLYRLFNQPAVSLKGDFERLRSKVFGFRTSPSDLEHPLRNFPMVRGPI